MTRQENADLIVSQVSIIIKKKIVTWLTSKLLFLAWGPFGPLISYFAGRLAEAIAKDAEMRVFFLYTDLRTDSQGKSYLKAMAAYRDALDNNGGKNVEVLESELNTAFRNLVMLSR